MQSHIALVDLSSDQRKNNWVSTEFIVVQKNQADSRCEQYDKLNCKVVIVFDIKVVKLSFLLVIAASVTKVISAFSAKTIATFSTKAL